MIVLGEKRDNTNVLHVIIGPETDFHFNMNGQSAMNITEYVEKMKNGEQCMLVVNPCESEEDLIQQLAYNQSKTNAMQELKNMMDNGFDQPTTPFGPLPGGDNKTSKNKSSGINCPKCKRPNVAIIQDGKVLPCKVCQEIDEGLRSEDIPLPPENDELKKLQDDIQDNNPGQKKSISRYKKKRIEDNIDDDDDELQIV